MNEFDFVKAALLGVIQGLTEFLPVSSSGHLAVVQAWLDLDAAGLAMLLFDVFAHLGTLVAVLIVFRRQISLFLRRLLRESARAFVGDRIAFRIALLGIVASVPTAFIGLAFKDKFEEAFGEPRWIGAALACTGAILFVTRWLPRPTRGWRQFLWWQAAIVGIAQGMAIMPGISRSGATICVALMLGLRRRWAGEFSFFIAVPAILGATVLKTADAFEAVAGESIAIGWGPIAVGGLLSFLTGIAALMILLVVVRRAQLHYFAFYCWLLSAAILSGLLVR